MSGLMCLLASTTMRSAEMWRWAERCAGYMLLWWKVLDVAYQVAINGACNDYLLVVAFSGAGFSATYKIAEVAQTLLRATRGLLRNERKKFKDNIDFGGECRRPLSFRSPKTAFVEWLWRTHVNTSCLICSAARASASPLPLSQRRLNCRAIWYGAAEEPALQAAAVFHGRTMRVFNLLTLAVGGCTATTSSLDPRCGPRVRPPPCPSPP